MRASLAVMAGSAAAAAVSPITCADGLYIIVGRGTTEAPGEGVSEVLADAIVSKIKGSEVLAVDYPASLDDPNYFESVQDGTKALEKELSDYVKKCPKGKVAYLGYSQGAQIASDAFCGVPSSSWGNTPTVAANTVNNNVVAIALYGDPSFFHGAPYNKGTAKGSGIFARNSTGECKNYADKIVSYCDDNDVYCDSGDSHEVHGSYIKTYKEQIVNFVVDKYAAAVKTGGSSTGGNSTSGGNSTTGGGNNGNGGNSTSGGNNGSGNNGSGNSGSGNNGSGNSGSGNNGGGNGNGNGNGGDNGGKSAATSMHAAHALLVAAPLAAIAALL